MQNTIASSIYSRRYGIEVSLLVDRQIVVDRGWAVIELQSVTEVWRQNIKSKRVLLTIDSEQNFTSRGGRDSQSLAVAPRVTFVEGRWSSSKVEFTAGAGSPLDGTTTNEELDVSCSSEEVMDGCENYQLITEATRSLKILTERRRWFRNEEIESWSRRWIASEQVKWLMAVYPGNQLARVWTLAA